jgi:hypothetical protein
MRLRAHHNVVDIAEARRERASGVARIQLVNFVGYQTQPAEPSRPYFVVPPEMLTPEEIAALRRRAKENSAYFRKAFAHLRPSQPPQPSHPTAQALLAGLLQGIGERENDAALLDAGKRLAEVAQKGQPAAPERRWRPNWLRAVPWGS